MSKSVGRGIVSYTDVIGYGGYKSVAGNGNANLKYAFQKQLDGFLDADVSDPQLGPQMGITDPVTGETYGVNEECYNIIQSYVTGNLASSRDLANPFASKGLVTSFNTTGDSAGPNLQAFGHEGNTYFYGFLSPYVKPGSPRAPRPAR